jgi:hypothetical protein
MWWPRDTSAVEARALVDLTADAVTGVEVLGSGDDARPLTLAKEGDAWVIASSEGYPAEADKVRELLDSLVDIKVRRPLATKAVNHDALSVGEKEFGKRVTLTAGETKVALVVGAASGQAAHVRLEGADEVYEARGLSEWSIKDRASGYWKPEVVDLDVSEATAIAIQKRDGSAVNLARGESGWTFEGPLAEGEILDPDKLTRLAEAACKLRLRDPAGKQVLPEHGLDLPAATVTVTSEAEDASSTFTYRLGNTADAKVYLQTEGSSWVVTVSEYSAKTILEASPATLALKLEEPAAAPQGLPPGLDLSGMGF